MCSRAAQRSALLAVSSFSATGGGVPVNGDVATNACWKGPHIHYRASSSSSTAAAAHTPGRRCLLPVIISSCVCYCLDARGSWRAGATPVISTSACAHRCLCLLPCRLPGRLLCTAPRAAQTGGCGHVDRALQGKRRASASSYQPQMGGPLLLARAFHQPAAGAAAPRC